MIKTAILDDSHDEVEGLEVCLSNHPLIAFVGNFTSANELLRQMNEVELLFCDIELKGLSGFDFLRSLKNPPSVVFISSHGNYALNSFEFEPLHFIQKPIDLGKVYEAIERMRLKKENRDYCARDFFFVKDGPHDYIKIDFKDILFISALDDYVQIYLVNSRVTTYQRLKEIKLRLPSQFIQIHRSYIVNLEQVKTINTKDIELKNGMEIPISASFREGIKKQIS